MSVDGQTLLIYRERPRRVYWRWLLYRLLTRVMTICLIFKNERWSGRHCVGSSFVSPRTNDDPRGRSDRTDVLEVTEIVTEWWWLFFTFRIEKLIHKWHSWFTVPLPRNNIGSLPPLDSRGNSEINTPSSTLVVKETPQTYLIQ